MRTLPPHGAKGEAAKGRAKGFRQSGDFHYTDQRAPTTPQENDEGLCQEVADLIRIATLCDRHKCGDIIWFGWECHAGEKPTWLWKGSHGIMLSKRGAAKIEIAMRSEAIERDHIDLALVLVVKKAPDRREGRSLLHLSAAGRVLPSCQRMRPEKFRRRQRGTTRWVEWQVEPREGDETEH